MPVRNQSMGGAYLGPHLSNANHSFFDKMKDGSMAVDEEVKFDGKSHKSKNRSDPSSSQIS